jgi:hypothetical protein
MNKTKQNKSKMKTKTKKNRRPVYDEEHFKSGDGMLTSVWGPGMWHYLHTMSFNYPVNPTHQDRKHYRDFILQLQHVLPCKFCRVNLKNNFKVMPLRMCDMKSRDTFSRYVYDLHEMVNKMLNKKSNLEFCDVRERYEHFRARCSDPKPLLFKFGKTKKQREKGCTEPLYGEKAKCVLHIVPQGDKTATFNMDERCVKKRVSAV